MPGLSIAARRRVGTGRGRTASRSATLRRVRLLGRGTDRGDDDLAELLEGRCPGTCELRLVRETRGHNVDRSGQVDHAAAQRADDRRVAAPGASEDDDLGVRERHGRLEDPCEGGHEDPQGGVALGCCGDPGAQEIGKAAKPVPELLFVCTQNSGRFQIAAAMLRRFGGDSVHVRSAGSLPPGEVNPRVVEMMAGRGFDLAGEFPRPITDDFIRAADVVITMGCGDACPIYPGRRYLDWDLPDPANGTPDVVAGIADRIETKVRQLLTELGIDPAKDPS
jgi:protein-tyrosine-phosphatase